MRIPLSLAALVFTVAVLPSAASAQSVALGEFRGSRSAAVRRDVAERLEGMDFQVADLDDSDEIDAEAAIEESGASVAVLATIQRRGRRYRGRARVYDAEGTELASVRASARNPGALATRLANQLEEPLREALGSSGGTEEEEPVRDSGGVRRVAIAPFAGSVGSRVRNQIVRALSRLDGVEVVEYDAIEELADEMDADLEDASGLTAVAERTALAALIEGRTRRRGRRFSASVQVREGASGGVVGDTVFRGRSASTLASAARSQAGSRLEPLIAQTSAPAQVADDDDDEDDEDEDEEDEDESRSSSRRPSFQAVEDLPVAIEASLWGSIFSRNYSYNEDQYERLREYDLPGGPAIALGFRYYPGAHFTSAWPANIGLEATYERAFGITSKKSDGNEFETDSQSFFVGLRGRLPVGLHEFSLVAGYGGHIFEVDTLIAGAEVSDSNLPSIPGVDYRFVRVGFEGRLGFGGFRLGANFNYNIVLDAGGVDDSFWFPGADFGGIDAGGTVGYALDVGSDGASVELWVGALYRRYWSSTNVDGASPEGVNFWAGGTLDKYINYSLGLSWRR